MKGLTSRITMITASMLMTISVRCGSRHPTSGGVTSHPGIAVMCPDNILNDVSMTSRVVSEIYSRLNLSTVVVIKGKEQGLQDHTERSIRVGITDVDMQLHEAEAEMPTMVSQYEVSPDNMVGDIRSILQTHNKLTTLPRHFFVTCSLNCTAEILRQVNYLDAWGPTQGVLTHLVRWVVLLKDVQQLDTLEELVGNVTHLTAVVDVTNTPLPVYQPSHRIYSASWTQAGRQFEEIGQYQDNRLLLSAPFFPNEQYGFNNRTFTITVNMWGPFLHTKNETNTSIYYDGMCIEMLEMLSNKLNFSYVLVEPADGKWGTMDNGTWEGIVAQLYNKEVDISIAPLAVSTLRETVVDFTFPFYLEYTAVLYGRTQQQNYTFSFFFQPFHWIVWILLGLAMLLTAFTITRLASVSPLETRYSLQASRHSLWFTLGAFLNQSTDHSPVAMSTRMVVGFFWFFCTVLVATYGANLVAFLTVTKTKTPFSTLEELVDQNDYMVGVIGGTIWEEMLQSSSINVYQRIWQKIVHNRANYHDFDVLHQETDRHVARARQGGHAVITDMTTMQLARQDSCDIVMMEEKFLPLRYAIAVQNNSVYRQIISDTVIRLLESGLMDMWHRKYWPSSDTCDPSSRQMARSIAVEDLMGVFVTGMGLIGLSSLLLWAELLIYRRLAHLRAKRTTGASHSASFHSSAIEIEEIDDLT